MRSLPPRSVAQENVRRRVKDLAGTAENCRMGGGRWTSYLLAGVLAAAGCGSSSPGGTPGSGGEGGAGGGGARGGHRGGGRDRGRGGHGGGGGGGGGGGE